MTSYAPNFTGRLRVKYRAAGGVHTQTWRFPTYGPLGVGMAAARDAVNDVWLELQNIMYDDLQCLGVTYAQEDSDIFLPTSLISAMIGTVATPVAKPSDKAYAVSFVGRTATGQPAKEFFYGIAELSVDVSGLQNFRLNPGENGAIDAAIAAANSFTAGLTLCGSDGTGVTWYPYANQKPNDYWVKRLRQG